MCAAASKDLRFPSIDGLRAFEAAARLGSFERAADELCITASAVSKRVSTLEELLGTALLLRASKALLPSAAGKEYLEQVRAALGLLSAMPLHQRATQRVQRLRVTMPPTFARQILVPRLDEFCAAHAHIELELVLSIPYLDSAPAPGDIEVRAAEPGAHPGASLLLADQVLPVASPTLLAKVPALQHPADLASLPLLRTPLQPWAAWFQAAGLDWPEPASGPKLVDLGLTLEAAVCGQGVALARPSLAWPWLASGTLKPLFALHAPAANPYLLLPHAADGPAPVFAAWLTEVCAQAQAQSTHWLSGLG